MISKYYSTKNGKKILKGYRARPFNNGMVFDERYFGAKEKLKAQKWHDRQLVLYSKGYDFTYTLEDAYNLYLEDFSGSINGKLFYTKSHNCLKMDIPKWLSKIVTDFKPTDVSQMMRELYIASEKRLGYQRAHLKREIVTLHAVFEHYKNEKNIDFTNPVTRRHKKDWGKAKGKRLVNEVVSHEQEELAGLFNWLKGLSDPVYFHIAFWQITSHRQRVSEILGLEWADVDWQKEIVWITGTIVHTDDKGKTLRNFKDYGTKEGRTKVPLFFGGENKHLKASLLALKELNRSFRWILADERGNVPSYRWLYQVYKNSGFFNEKNIATHKCRKTAITLGTILCGSDTAKTHAGHSTWEAHGRYVNTQQTELSNPIPAAIAKSLGLENGLKSP